MAQSLQQFIGKVEITTAGSQVGELIVRDANGKEVFWFGAGGAALSLGNEGNEGDLRIFDKTGQCCIHLDGETGDIVLNGGDCAEYFDVGTESDLPEPGTVMSVDAGGKLRPCQDAYDSRVVGVVSGAGPLQPGIILGARSGHRPGALIAVTGTTYCKVDASYGPIKAGDLLTTSGTQGHAMRAMDPGRAFGSVLGKALAPLAEGVQLIPILVALQ